MYRIGEFSKITQLSVKTLRYYDDEGLLSPSYRDEETHYRYYQEADFERAELLKLLRSLDFSIMEIKDVIATIHDPEDITYYLLEKQDQIRREIKAKQHLIKKMKRWMEPKQPRKAHQPYPITWVKQDAQLVASLRYEGKYQDVGHYLGKMYKEIKGNLASSSAPFNLYYDEEFQEQATIEICIPIQRPFSSSICDIKTIPACSGISATHYGSYDELNYAYKAIMDEAYNHSITLCTPSLEIYHKGPGKIFKGNPNTYMTQIIIPTKEDLKDEQF